MSTTFRILPGLPPYGPLPRQFSPDGRGAHREGLVVEFRCGTGDWVGNFQRGLTGFDSALLHPDRESVIIVAGGQGYLIDPATRTLTLIFGGDITDAVCNGPEQVVLATSTYLLSFGAGGHQWRTRRLSWDGFRSLRVAGQELRGEAWTFAGDRWIEFSVQLATGEATGGAYP